MISAILITAFITYYFTRLFFLIPAYKDQMAFIENNISNFPDMFAGWTWLGIEKKQAGMNYAALEAWYKGLKLRPQDFRLNWNVASTLAELGFLSEAVGFYETAKASAIPETLEAETAKKIDGEIAKIKALISNAENQRRNAIIDAANQYKKRK